MKLDKEPRIEDGPNFMFSLKAILRNVALVVNEALSTVTGGTLAGNLSISKASPVLNISATSGDANVLFNGSPGTATNLTSYRGSNPRWQLVLTTNEAETGANAGSNFAIVRFSDAGAYIGPVLSIRRSDGAITSTSNATFAGTQIVGGAEALKTANVGTSGSTYFNNVLTVTAFGSIGVLSYQHNPGVIAQWQFQANNSANFSFLSTGRAQAPVAWDIVSDERLKTNIKPVIGALERLDLVDVVTFERVDEPPPMSGPSKPTSFIGVLAQKMRLAQPESVTVAGTEAMPDRLVVASDGAGLLALAATKELKALVLALITQTETQQQLIAELRAEIDLLKGA